VSGGTIFLDEVGELPLETQARLLRVLESGEFIKVGSSKVQKTDVRVVAATNRDLLDLAAVGKFREDLYYRMSTVPIRVPSLRDRQEDIHLLFRKFSADFAEKYRAKPIVLEPDAQQLLVNYRWPGNIRQLKNIAEQLSVLDEDKIVNAQELSRVLPAEKSGVPMLMSMANSEQQLSEREIFYKVLFDLRKDVMELKGIVFDMMQNGVTPDHPVSNAHERMNQLFNSDHIDRMNAGTTNYPTHIAKENIIELPVDAAVSESLSLEDKEVEMIKKALKKHNGRRKRAAAELGISERTLYRKIKQYDMEE
jgi:DNA-binding NtrC family response regulator